MIVKVGRSQRKKLLLISIDVLLLAMILFTSLLSTTIESMPVGGEFRVNTTTSYWQETPSAAMDPDGNFVIAWSGEGPGDNYGILMQRYDSSGNPLGGESRVNTYTLGSQFEPSVAMDSTGNFVICWFGEGASDSWGVYAQRFDAFGNPQGTEFRVNTYTANNQEFARIAMNSTGNFNIKWVS